MGKLVTKKQAEKSTVLCMANFICSSRTSNISILQLYGTLEASLYSNLHDLKVISLRKNVSNMT
jgi:hypothetical protein